MEVNDLLNGGRNAFSSGEASLNGSLNGLSAEDDKALGDSEVKDMQRAHELANQIKSPSSNLLENECMSQRLNGINNDEKSEEEEWVDILGNGELMKKVTRAADGRRPELGELVKISFKNLSNSDEPTTAQFVLGYGFNIDAFDVSIPLMYVGEQALIKAKSRFVDNSENDSFTEYELELLDVQLADTVDLSVRISEAREAGNDYYNKGRYEKALRLYDYGIRLLTEAEGSVEDTDLRKYTLISNSAACLIKLGELEKVVELTNDLPFDDTLEVDKLILTKIVLRRSDALIKLKRYTDAAESLKVCLTIDPSNTLAKSLLDQITLRTVKDEKKLKSMYRNMFKALGKDETSRVAGPIQAVKSFFSSKRILVLALLVCFVAIVIHLFRVYYN